MLMLSSLLDAYTLYGLGGDGVPGLRWTGWLAKVTFLPAFLTLVFLLPLLFPTGRLLSPRWRVVIWLAIGVVVNVTSQSAFAPGRLAQFSEHPQMTNPLGSTALEPVLSLADAISTGLIPIVLISATVALYVRLRRSRGIERQQVKWLIYAGLVVIGTFVVTAFTAVFTGDGIPEAITFSVFALAVTVGLPASVGIAILRYHLWGIDLIISRTLIYVALSVCVVAIYMLIVGWLGTIFRTGGNLLFSLVATGIVAVAFQPLRERIQHAVNRLLYGERDEPYAVIARLGRRLEETFAPEAVLPAIAGTVREALRLPYTAIALHGVDQPVVVASIGDPVPEPVRVPLAYQHEPVGELLLAPRPGETTFSPADRRLLDDLARQAGVAVHAVQLTSDLQQARERLVAAREEERRRLRRDLHDGLGSRLAALTMQLGVLRGAIAADPAAAEVLAVEIRAKLRESIADIRRIVQNLRPAVLDELGLVDAIRARVRQYDVAGLAVRVDAPLVLPPLPAAAEVAAHRITEEALANVSRHAGPVHCVVHLRVADALELSIEDDGAGIDPGARTGLGMRSRNSAAHARSGRGRAAERASLPVCPWNRGLSMPPEALRVPIADDHPLVHKGLEAVLASVEDIVVVGQASTGTEAVALAAELQPDVVLMDLQMPDMGGIEATRQILAADPRVRVLVVTLFEDDDSIYLALRAGARGYVLKDADEEELRASIRAVAGGAAMFGPTLAGRVLAPINSPRPAAPPIFPDLTEREREVLELLAQGLSNPRIAQHLGLSVKTVGNHVSIIFGKLHVADRAEAIVRAREAGLGRSTRR
jgi:DNA-binding NarL/FixJ family response regulator/signal transduction histidine kinase